MHGAFAIMAALYHQKNTGEGQYIDAAMIEGSINFLGEMVMAYNMNGVTGERMGNRDRVMAPHGCYRCKGDDEWVAIAVSSEDEWQAFCKVIDSPEWTMREEFSTRIGRWNNQDELDALITEWTRERHQYEIMELLQKAGIPTGASLNVKDLVDDPQLKARKFFIDMQHPVGGELTLPGLPWRPADDTAPSYSPAPLLGEHNYSVFGELLGLTREEVDRLITEEVIK